MIQIISYTGAERKKREEELRRAFAVCYGSDAEMPEIQKTAKGKPYFITAKNDPRIFLSITDSESWRMVAFSDSEIGIDLQFCRMHGAVAGEDNWRKCMAIAKRFFHPAEYAWITDDKETVKDRMRRQVWRFFRIWTAREAYVKYRGTGFDGTFRSFDVLHDFPELCFDYPETCDGYMLCVCHGNAEPVMIRKISTKSAGICPDHRETDDLRENNFDQRNIP